MKGIYWLFYLLFVLGFGVISCSGDNPIVDSEGNIGSNGDDESNGDTAITRNFLRHQTLVALGQRFPAAESALALAASHFAEAGGLLDELAELDWQRVAEGGAARLGDLRQLSVPRVKNLLRHRLRLLGWQVPVASRLDEFVRQVLTAGPDRHPELVLPDGKMRVAQRRLHWLSVK